MKKILFILIIAAFEFPVQAQQTETNVFELKSTGDLFFGCTDPIACNYDPGAEIDDGSCEYPGCNDPAYCNFDPMAMCDDGSCDYLIPANDDCSAAQEIIWPSETFDWFFPSGCSDAGSPNCGFSNSGGDTWYSFTSQNTNPVNISVEAFGDAAHSVTVYDSCGGNVIAFGCNSSFAYLNAISVPVICNQQIWIQLTNVSSQTTFSGYFYVGQNPDNDGCNDPTACNYSECGLTNSNCVYPGCTEPLACNFDPFAGCDDGSCQLAACTDLTACNYDPLAVCDDGSCEPSGCIDTTACNYDSAALCDDGSCSYPGCIYSEACNYNSLAGCDDGTCEFNTCAGCTYPAASNYDPAAIIDDGSCAYDECSGDANGDGFVNVLDLIAVSSSFGDLCP